MRVVIAAYWYFIYNLLYNKYCKL